MLGNFAGGEWKQHHDALLKIIELRGGFDTIDQEHLRITVSWYVRFLRCQTVVPSCLRNRLTINRGDLISSFAQDIPPAVPLPRQWAEDCKSPSAFLRPYSAVSLAWKQQMPMKRDWITVFDDILHLVSLDRTFNEKQLELAITSGSWVEPTIYRLLAIRPLNHGSERENLLEEVCRLGTLLFLAPFWRLLGQSPVRTTAISRNLQLVLLQNTTDWNQLKPILVWTLYFAAIETSDLAERSRFVFMLAMVATGLRAQTWNEILQIVKSVTWVDKVFAGTEDLIKDEVTHIINQRPRLQVVEDGPFTILGISPEA